MLFHLLERDGKSTQAEIARIEDFGNVKAMRLVNKMQEKQLIDVYFSFLLKHIWNL